MVTGKADINEKRYVLSELAKKRAQNVETALSWTSWEIEDQLKRAEAAKESFLVQNPLHDLCIIEEHISQLHESLKLKNLSENPTPHRRSQDERDQTSDPNNSPSL